MVSLLASLLSREEGQSIVELSIMAPLLVVLMVGAVDVGSFIYGGIEVGNAAHAAVQYGAQSMSLVMDSAGIAAAGTADAKQLTAFRMSAPTTYCACDSNQSVTVSCSQTSPAPCPSPDRRDLFLKVTASSTFTPIFHYPGLPGSLVISRTSIQQIVD
jgi:Flp pilus assembly protein TadG